MQFARDVRSFVGEVDFEMIEVASTFAEVGLIAEAQRLLDVVCVAPVAEGERDPLVLYWLAWCSASQGESEKAQGHLTQAAAASKDFVFPSRPETVAVLERALELAPDDARAHLHLGNLYGHFGRLDDAVIHWRKATEPDASLSIAFRNLACYAHTITRDDAEAARLYRQAIAARPDDQTLYRDLAKILAAGGDYAAAIELLESMPVQEHRRADASLTLAKAYIDAGRFDAAIDLLTTTPHFINWEGGSLPWDLFRQAHLARGRQRLEDGQAESALGDFEAAMTYPGNLGVGRSDKPQHATALYWKGEALHALGRLDEAQDAWTAGASGPEGSDEQNEYRDKCRAALSRDQ